jgi:hypothetical protein
MEQGGEKGKMKTTHYSVCCLSLHLVDWTPTTKEFGHHPASVSRKSTSEHVLA